MNETPENFEANRDPFRASRPEPDSISEPPRPFCFRAAKWSLWVPVIAGLLLLGFNNLVQDASGSAAFWLQVATLAGFGMAVLAGLVLGIIALWGIAEHGGDGLLGHGLRGVGASLLLMGCLAVGIVHLLQLRSQNQAALLTARARATPDVLPAQPQTPATVPAAPNPAPQAPAGADALATQAAQAYAQEMQILMLEYARATMAIDKPPVINMRGVDKREQLQDRKELVKKFVFVNEKLKAFVVNSEGLYRQELEKVHCPADKIQTTLTAFRDAAQQRNALTLQIRDADERKGAALLGMLDVLDIYWGRWNYDQDSRRVLFEDSAALDKYLAFRQAMEAASDQQRRLQAQLMLVASN
jgi:hypothetical protein